MSAASDRANAALATLTSAAQDFISKRSQANASAQTAANDLAAQNTAQTVFEGAQAEVDAAIEAVKAEKSAIVDGAK